MLYALGITHSYINCEMQLKLCYLWWDAAEVHFFECPMLIWHNGFISTYKHCSCWRGIKEASFWASEIILLKCTVASLIGPCETAEKWWQSWRYFLVNCRISSLSLSIKVSFVIHPTHVVILITRGGKLPHSYLTANPCFKEP